MFRSVSCARSNCRYGFCFAMVRNITQSSSPRLLITRRAYSLKNTTAKVTAHSVQYTASNTGPQFWSPLDGDGGVIGAMPIDGMNRTAAIRNEKAASIKVLEIFPSFTFVVHKWLWHFSCLTCCVEPYAERHFTYHLCKPQP